MLVTEIGQDEKRGNEWFGREKQDKSTKGFGRRVLKENPKKKF